MTQNNIIGIDIGTSSVKTAYIQQRKGGFTVIALCEDVATDVKQLNNTCRDAIAPHKDAVIISPLDTPSILIRSLEIPITKPSDLHAAIPFKAEPLLPFPLEDGLLENLVIEKRESSTLITLFAVTKTTVDQYLSELNNFDIEPDIISCVPQALAAFVHEFSSSNEEVSLIIHLGDKTTTCATSFKGKILASRSISLGSNDITSAIMSDKSLSASEAKLFFYENFDFTDIDASDLSLTLSIVDSLKNELVKTVLSLETSTKKILSSVFISTGNFSLSSNTPSFLETALTKKNLLLSYPTSTIKNHPDCHRFAVPLGLAISATKNNSDTINFRKETFSHPRPLRHIKKALISYLSLSALLTISLFTLGKGMLHHQEQQLQHSYSSFVETYKESLSLSTALNNTKEEGSLSSSHINLSFLSSSLSDFESTISGIRDDYTLFPSVPRVCDLLAWLSTRPYIVSINEETKEKSALISLENLTYTMVKRPGPAKKKDPYLVKVKLSFSTPTPRIAREFHQAILEDTSFINNKYDVSWNTGKDSYTISFYLKNKKVGT
ncbi:MAG: pilus assembly protein PilM [Waddliaceae bacterium]|jgi:type IV pilus assembly protein PilM|nr:pilus assembly protein PilM [Waddliaceae bacterium]MBT3579356.1 pilus assembly protein PilM [Waddliaceae bacterium]MBT4444846.1 pilus assembly protein PilM [Waddliaceae bacterium]MBT6928018.1 pilus assembly protein PilM [Waddliaceae bacterium]MBT7264306.1 pilus assembly protein PilM [Waddliaceae bacterium]